MKKLTSLLLCLLTLLLIPAAAFAGDYSFVSDKGVKLQFPEEKSYYEEPFEAIVDSQSGKKDGGIYIMPKAKSGNGHLGTVADGETVTILAEQSGYYFFVTEEGYCGWNGKKWFKSDWSSTKKVSSQDSSTVSDKGVELEYPDSWDYYKVPFVMYVESGKKDGSGSIYLMPKPEAGNGNLGHIRDGKAVLILAEHGGYFFFQTEDGRFGWNGEKWFVS